MSVVPTGSIPSLGRLERVELKAAWKHEAGEFTPWLSQAENLALLGQAIELDLEFEASERSVGPFRADILCKSALDSHWVLIENQIERTDHGHLGQLLTYAAGLDAVTIVWIASRFTDEHRAALDWLNQKTDEGVNFFGLEIELWRIGTSPSAPKFNVVSKPNNWSATVAQMARAIDGAALTSVQEVQLAYWQAFVETLGEHLPLRHQSARPQDSLFLSSGRAGLEYKARVTSRAPWIQAGLSFSSTQREAVWFPILLAQRDEIDQQLGHALPWDQPPDGFKENRMAIRLEGADFQNQDDWPKQHAWLREQLAALFQVFAPRIRELPAPNTVVTLESDPLGDEEP